MTNDASFLATPFSRRQLLKGGAGAAAGAALAAYLPSSVRKAIAGANPTSFDLSQVKHIVLLMQENRSFDHYFGTLSGVRGFGDPRAMRLPSGRSVFAQPDGENPDSFLLPYHLDSSNSAAQAVPSLSHAWQVQHASWANGEMDGWLRSHIAADSDTAGPYTMGYYTSEDIPFQFALANAFTICDNYFCSILGPTHPNRYMWMTGTVDPDGKNGGPALDNNAPNGTYNWTTTAERLENAGISWKCYQQADNFGTNVLEFFSQFINAPTSSNLFQSAFGVSTLFGGGTASDPAMAFEEDCANGTLPTVSWIFPTSVASEHPAFLPAAGAQFVASKLEALAANEDLWNSTVFILNYDENDGFFDHVPPIVPPKGTADEFASLNSPGGTPGGGLNLGSGFRVPAFVISPWSVGGFVCTDPLDHTSVLRFIERVTGITETNISAWRRSTFGDFTSAFQRSPEPAPVIPAASAAATAAELAFQTQQSTLPLPPFPGQQQSLPSQQPGRRPTVG